MAIEKDEPFYGSYKWLIQVTEHFEAIEKLCANGDSRIWYAIAIANECHNILGILPENHLNCLLRHCREDKAEREE